MSADSERAGDVRRCPECGAHPMHQSRGGEEPAPALSIRLQSQLVSTIGSLRPASYAPVGTAQVPQVGACVLVPVAGHELLVEALKLLDMHQRLSIDTEPTPEATQ